MSSRAEKEQEHQKQLLKQFRKNVADILTPRHTDAELLKWLRARDFNLKKAEVIFREVDSSRKTYGVNTIVQTYKPPEVFTKFQRTAILGFCKEGSIVRYISIAMDFYGLIMSTTAIEDCMHCSYFLEHDSQLQQKENIRTGRDVSGTTYLIDMREFDLKNYLSKYVLQMGLDLLPHAQEHHPEFCHRIFVVNAPAMFEKLYNLFTPVLKQSLQRKILVASPDHTADMLRKYMDENILPAFLGGTRYDSNGDPYCSEFLGKYEDRLIPETYYLKNCRRMLSETDTGVKTVYIAARTSYNVPVIIKRAGTRIKIEFRTDNGDIYFALLYRPFGNDFEKPDVPGVNEYLDPYDEKCNVQRISLRLKVLSHLWTSTQTDLAHRAGIHILQFDNTPSWITSRTLYYRVTLIDPKS